MKYPSLESKYAVSRALIFGINKFRHASPLNYAVSDALAVKDVLVAKYAFSPTNIVCLTDEEATRAAVTSAYMALGGSATQQDDRLLVFYAGHGMTTSGARGPIGFLDPHDGNPKDLSTLIRWDEFTFNAELINAKHILFVMDACYSGLVFQRSVGAGSVRFLKDMMLRRARQVITAGKADEVVADSGGPRPEHSVFTGHLLDALDGRAAGEDGILTANGLMSYVYDKVSRDHHSRQTPHYGTVDGDGDFVFSAPILAKLTEDKMDDDILVTVPSVEVSGSPAQEPTLADRVKDQLSDPRSDIRLHDLAVQHSRAYLVETSPERFPVQGAQFSVDEFKARLTRYEDVVEDLKTIAICIAHWGQPQHLAVLQKMISRATDALQPESGLVVWNALRWYPAMILSYSAGIAAIAARRYDSLHSLFSASVPATRSTVERADLIWSVGEAISEIERTEVFKKLPGHDRNYTPRSEYLYKLLQPDLDDILFLGKTYETLFDEYEVLQALAHADSRMQRESAAWGPIGRFGWKYHSRMRSENPLEFMIETARKEGSAWAPIRAGLFGGSIDRFNACASEYQERIKKLGWW